MQTWHGSCRCLLVLKGNGERIIVDVSDKALEKIHKWEIPFITSLYSRAVQTRFSKFSPIFLQMCVSEQKLGISNKG